MDPRRTTPPYGPDPTAPPRDDGFDSAGWAWEQAYGRQQTRRPPLPDISPLLALIDGLRRIVPPELQEQFLALQRELLLTVRALIDWYLERLDARARPLEVEDIPID